MKSGHLSFRCLHVMACVLFVLTSGCADRAREAVKIIEDSGIEGGLVVHLGVKNGKFTAVLHDGESFLVHGLAQDAGSVKKARRFIRDRGIYGEVTVEQWSHEYLPYSDDLVNLLVTDGYMKIDMDEIMRVLVPGGIAFVKAGGEWTSHKKPRPETLDQWTHYLHGPGNNAVAGDEAIGPPRQLKWKCGPRWSRSHEFNSSLCTMVASENKIFYIFDKGVTSMTDDSIPTKWTLFARDAFNGVLLWKLPLKQWDEKNWGNTALRAIPEEARRRLVADGEKLFVTPAYVSSPVSLLDAGTGDVLDTYDQTKGTQEFLLAGNLLVCRISGKSGAGQGSGGNITAVSPASGDLIWKTGELNLLPNMFAAAGDKVFFIHQDQGKYLLSALDLQTGRKLWNSPVSGEFLRLMASQGKAIVLEEKRVMAFNAENGRKEWQYERGEYSRMARHQDIFVIKGTVWFGDGYHTLTGIDLQTGEIKSKIKPDEVLSLGHHPRCYPSKATGKYIITPFRGVEFISVSGGPHVQCDWTRGACTYGVMPANGLLYNPQHPCFCYPGVKVTGLNAFGSARTDEIREEGQGERLIRGEAYGSVTGEAFEPDEADWPAYRYDSRRYGKAGTTVPANVSVRWETNIEGDLTSPVVAGGRLYVSAKDQNILYTMDATSGKHLWDFAAGGSIDSPPTIYGELVLFGSADGWVYALRAADGKPVWKFRAAPNSRRIVSFNRLESPWRVHGSVLVENGVAYFTAGRSTNLDGGIRVYGLDVFSGEILYQTRLDTWSRDRKDSENQAFLPGYHMEGALSDVLVCQDGYIYLGQYMFDMELNQEPAPYVMDVLERDEQAIHVKGKPYTAENENEENYEVHQREWLERTQTDFLAELRNEYGGWNLGRRQMKPHVLAVWGFLDDSWFNRSFWMYSDMWPGYYISNRAAKTGQLLVVGPGKTYALQAYPSRNLQSPLPSPKGYLLYADDNATVQALQEETIGTTKGWGYTRNRPPVWYKWVPVRIRAMTLAGENLFVAGPPHVIQEDPEGESANPANGRLWVVSTADGGKVAGYNISSPPVFDGMIAARGKLFISTIDGSVLCLGQDQ